MTEVTVSVAPPLVTVPNVELMHTGQWPISTGIATFTTGDLRNAVAALDCPAVRRPVLKLGHDEPDPDERGIRWDGEPAVGYVANMAVAEGGQTLVGDYAGMPSWLGGEVLASAYPDRSIEGQYDFRCQIGHTHPFVITAVALLGVVAPGIGTLQSLQDVAALYGVTDAEPVAASVDPSAASGPSFTLTVHAAREDAVPNPHPVQVRAGVTTDDVRRAFYTSDYGKSWDIWICEMQLGPDLQLITTDDNTGSLSRIPVTIGDGDGEDAVEFGEPVKVVVRYEDAPVAAAAGGESAPSTLVFASRAESRPGPRPAPRSGEDTTTVEPSADPVDPVEQPEPVSAAGTSTQEGAAMDAAKLREALGLSPEASDDDVRATLTEQGMTPAQADGPDPDGEPDTEGNDDETEVEVESAPVEEPVGQQAATLPPGTVAIDETTLTELREQAQQGVAARAQQKREDRDRTLDAAVKAGKFPPARRAHWETYWETDEAGAKAAIAKLAEGLVPVEDVGQPGGELTDEAVNAEFDRIFPTSPKARS